VDLMKKLKLIDFVSIFLRSFYIQATWNYKGLLSIGFCMAMIPVAKRLYGTTAEYKRFLYRHLNFFNSHPYMASYALGAIARLEEELANTHEQHPEKIDKFKNALIGPLGAVGDQLFWATIKPAVAIFAMAVVLVIENLQTKLLFLFVLLMLYNMPHLYVRWVGILEGYRQGYNIYRILKIEHFSHFQRLYMLLGAASLGIFCGFYMFDNLLSDALGVLVFLISLGIAMYARTRRTMVYRPILIPLTISLIVGILVTQL
jgi:mannose/fructose/N-acetylgalactosamine-specific phosphotransferase system component IID